MGISGVLILVGAATTSFSGITRLTYSLAEHGSLPREFARLERRSVVSSEAIAIAAALAIGLIVLTELAAGGDPAFLASLYSFGVLIAFTAAQLAVVRLRMREPDLERPYRAWPNVSIRGHQVPVAALIGAPLTAAIFVLAMITHPGARYAGPVWLLAGLAVFVAVRRTRRRGLFEQVSPVGELPSSTEFERILVPMKLGDIGEEMVATAIALAKERARRSRRSRSFASRGSSLSKASSRPRSQPESMRRSRRREPSAPITEWRCTGTSFVRDRSVTPSSRRPSGATPTSSFSARRRGGVGSRDSSRRPSTSSSATRRARSSWWRSPTESSRSRLRSRERRRDRVWTRGILGREGSRRRRLGRHGDRRERGRPRATRTGVARGLRRRARHGRHGPRARRHRRRQTLSSSRRTATTRTS